MLACILRGRRSKLLHERTVCLLQFRIILKCSIWIALMLYLNSKRLNKVISLRTLSNVSLSAQDFLHPVIKWSITLNSSLEVMQLKLCIYFISYNTVINLSCETRDQLFEKVLFRQDVGKAPWLPTHMSHAAISTAVQNFAGTSSGIKCY